MRFLLGCLCLMTTLVMSASADVTPPYGGVFQSDDRFVTDQFCFAKQDGAACRIPGHEFDGAGAGVCRTIKDKYIDGLVITTCHPHGSALSIDRGFPSTPFDVSYYQRCVETSLIQRSPSTSLTSCSPAIRGLWPLTGSAEANK